MKSNSPQDALRSRWTLEGQIPLSGVADGAQWRRARSVDTGEPVLLFIVQGEAALEAADAVRRAYLVEDPRLLPVRDIVVLDDPRDSSTERTGAGDDGPTTVVEYPLPPAPPLAALLAEGPLHPETARAIIGEAASALEVARRRGVRHQFIDSNRVFVDTASGAVTVLGIGVEAAAHPGLDRSREIASFQDTAALVALLYRALTGRSPQPDAAGRILPPSAVVESEIPRDLDLLCELVLGESEEEIPETTRGLIEALEPWQSIPVTLEAYPRATTPVPVPDNAPPPADGSGAEPPTEQVPAAEDPTLSGADVAGVGAVAAAGTGEAAGVPGAIRGAVSEEREQADQTPGHAPEVVAEQAQGSTSGQAPSEESSPHASSDAAALVKDLHLDQKRTSSPFPGRLDLGAGAAAPAEEPPRTAQQGAVPSAGSPSPSAAAGIAVGAAASVPPAAPAQDDALFPSRTAGTQWPLAPTESPDGSDGRPQQPPAGDAGAGSLAPTPEHSAASPSPAAMSAAPAAPAAASEQTAQISPVAPAEQSGSTGPIVVQGRQRSLLEDPVEEDSATAARSTLFRDVVSVAVAADDPDTFTMGPQDQERRSLQSQWIIIGGVIIVMAALIFAVTAVTSGLRGVMSDPLATSAPPETSAPVEEETDEAPVEPTEEPTEEPALPAPELGGTELFAEGSDQPPDHTDQQERLDDGDPESFWSTQHYASPDYGGVKEGVGIRLDFAEPSTLTAVTVTTARNNGGVLELRALNDDGSLGDVLATGSFAGDGEVRLEPEEPVEAERVALYVPELPPDSNESGRFRARIAEITVE